MKKLTLIILLSVLLFSSCGKADDQAGTKIPDKKPFLVETQILGKKTESYTVEKTARLTAGSSLVLASESVGEVTNISLKEGAKIKRGMTLVSLRDTVNSYDIRVAQAQNTVLIQDTTIESTKINLDRAVEDSQIAYEQAQKNYDNLLAKNNLIVDTLLNNNKKTLESYNETYKTYLSSIEGLMTNFLHEGDKILGVTTNFEYLNDGWEPYLGIKIGNAYALAKTEWDKVYSSRGEIRAKKDKGDNISGNNSNIVTELALITNAYTRTQAYVDAMLYMLQNNAVGSGLPQVQQDGWLALWNGIKSQIQTSESSYSAWKAQTLNFFQNYQNTEKATKLAVESLNRSLTSDEEKLLDSTQDMRITYNTTLIDLKDRIASAKLALRQAENARNTALKSRGATLSQLSASRQSGVLSLEQAKREYSKLAITAPFDGTIAKVLATVGQRVNPGTPIIEVVTNTPEIIIDLDADTADSLVVGDFVQVTVDEKNFTGSILAISRAAGANLLYSTRISIPDAKGFIGSAATIIFTASRESLDTNSSEKIILPLKSIKIISEQEGEIALISSGNTLEYLSVKLGAIVGENVIIESSLNPKIEIILSDVSNYDPLKFVLERRANSK